MAQKQKREKIVTPVGVVKFSHLTVPNTKFNKLGEFSVDLLLDPADPAVAKLKESLEAKAQEVRAKALAEAKDGKTKKAIEAYEVYTPFSADEDKEGNETGNVVFKAKQKAVIEVQGKDPIKKTVAIFDAKQKPLLGKKIGRGTKMKVACTLAPFVAPGLKTLGVSVWLEAVQIIELHEFGGGSADSFGFGEEEGYTDEGETQQSEGEAKGEEPTGEANPDFA